MRIILTLLSAILNFTESARYTLDRVQDVPGTVEKVDFDGQGNIYVATITYIKSNYLFKLSPTRELIWRIDLEPPFELVTDMRVTSYGDVYLVYFDYDVEIIEKIAAYTDSFFYMDRKDNLIYARENGTLHLLKPNTTVPVPIKNLEGYVTSLNPSYGVEDSKGNVYLGIFGNTDLKSRVALISAQSLQQEVPEAQVFEIEQWLNDLVIDKNDDLWIISHESDQTGFISKLVNGAELMIHADQGHPDLLVTPANDRIYAVGSNFLQLVGPNVYYVTLDNQVVEIPELSQGTPVRFFLSDTVADKDGNAYFRSWNEFTSELGYSFAIIANEDKPVALNFTPSLASNEYVDAIYMDDFGGVWLVTSQDKVRFVEKGDIVAQEVDGINGDDCNEFPVVTNPVTKDIFLSCLGGLYVAVDNSKR